MHMEEHNSLLAGIDQHDQNGAEKPKIHLFVTPTEVTFLTDEEYKLRTQPDEQVIQSTAFVSDHEHLSQLQTQPLVPLKQKASKSSPLAPGMVLLVNIRIIPAIFFLAVHPLLTQSVPV